MSVLCSLLVTLSKEPARSSSFFLALVFFLHFSVECYLLSNAELENTQSPHQTISW
jgi:hypothetical protein